MMGSAYRMGVDPLPRIPHDNSHSGRIFFGGIGPGGGKVGGTSPGANGCPKDEGEGTRAGRWGCRGLRTGEAKRGWQTGTASYEHEGAENMSCMTARVPGVREAMGNGGKFMSFCRPVSLPGGSIYDRHPFFIRYP